MMKFLTWLLGLLRKTRPPVLSIPHPEEPPDRTATAANTQVQTVLTEWLKRWNVPPVHWDYWLTKIDVRIYDAWPPECLALGIQPETPAYATEANGVRQLNALAPWLNPGVVAHEQAHNSYALLTAEEMAAFSAAYHTVRDTDPLIKLLYSVNRYGLTSDVEGHAEIARYLGDRMPESLKPYYPKLMEVHA